MRLHLKAEEVFILLPTKVLSCSEANEDRGPKFTPTAQEGEAASRAQLTAALVKRDLFLPIITLQPQRGRAAGWGRSRRAELRLA